MIIIQSLVQGTSSHTISLFGSHPNHPVFGDRNKIESGLFVFSKNSKFGPPSFTRLRVRFVAALRLIATTTVPTGPGAINSTWPCHGTPCVLPLAFYLEWFVRAGGCHPRSLGDQLRPILRLFSFLSLLFSCRLLYNP